MKQTIEWINEYVEGMKKIIEEVKKLNEVKNNE